MNANESAESLPHFQQRASDPTLASGALGVLVHTGGVESSTDGPRWPLRGSFRVPRSGKVDEPQAVLQRIVITLTDRSSHELQARHAFRDELLFPEDVRLEGDIVSGHFHVDLLRLFELDVPDETYFVAASIGAHVSPVVQCTCHMPWLANPLHGPMHVDERDESAAWGVEAEAEDDEDEDDDGDTRWMVNDPR